jgi:hypothetical protein
VPPGSFRVGSVLDLVEQIGSLTLNPAVSTVAIWVIVPPLGPEPIHSRAVPGRQLRASVAKRSVGSGHIGRAGSSDGHQR